MQRMRSLFLSLVCLLLLSCGAVPRGPISGIVYSSHQECRLYLLDPNTMERHILLEGDGWSGAVSPDGQKVLYTRTIASSQEQRSEIWVGSLNGSAPVLLWEVPFLVHGALWSFDGRKIDFSSPWQKGAPVCSREFYILDLAGRTLSKLPTTGWISKWSPVDNRIAILCTSNGRSEGFQIVDVDTGERKELFVGKFIPEPSIAWSPDGRSIAFPANSVPGRMVDGIFIVDVESGVVRQVTTEDTRYLDRGITCLSWSPRGDKILFLSGYRTKWESNARALFALDLTRGEETKLVEETKQSCPVWSPDGEEIAFVSTAHPNSMYPRYNQIYKVNLATGEVTQLTDDRDPKSSLSWRWVVLPNP